MDLSKTGIDFVNLLKIEQKAEHQETRRISRQSATHPTTSSLDESVYSGDKNEPNGVQLEATSKGKVKGSVSMSYYKAGANWPLLILLLMSFVVVQLLASFVDIWVSIW